MGGLATLTSWARVGGGCLSSDRGNAGLLRGWWWKGKQLRGGSIFIAGRDREAAVSGPMARRHACVGGAHADTPRARRGERRLRLACGPGKAVGPKHQWDGLPWVAGSEYVVGGEYPPARLRTSPPGSANW